MIERVFLPYNITGIKFRSSANAEVPFPPTFHSSLFDIVFILLFPFHFFFNIPLLYHLLNESLLFFAIADRCSRFLNISATTATFIICLFEFPEMQFEVSRFTCSRFSSYPEFVGHAWIRWCWSLRLLRRQLWLRTPLPLLFPLLPPYVSLFPYIYCDRSGCSETLLWRAEEGLSLLSKSLLIVFCFLIVLILFAFIVCK